MPWEKFIEPKRWKCSKISFNRGKIHIQSSYSLNGLELKFVETQKDLGVLFDDGLLRSPPEWDAYETGNVVRIEIVAIFQWKEYTPHWWHSEPS